MRYVPRYSGSICICFGQLRGILCARHKGNGPDLWIDLQRAYDLHVAEKELVKVLAKIPTITAA
jgi:hypothetical protein